jgi:hypothetical protein
MVIDHYNYPTLPSQKTKVLSSLTIFTYLTGIVVGAYAVSIGKDKIMSDEFTVSQALAFGSRELMITCFIFAYIFMIMLIWERGPLRFIELRSLLLTVFFALLITIIYVTKYYNEEMHFTMAGIMFIANLIFILLTAHIFRGYLRNEPTHHTYIFDGLIVILVAAFVLVNVYGVFETSRKTFIDDEIFATNELITIFSSLGVIYYLGFH